MSLARVQDSLHTKRKDMVLMSAHSSRLPGNHVPALQNACTSVGMQSGLVLELAAV